MKNLILQNITIRKASLLDVTEIANIHLNCWRECYKGIIDQTFLDSLKLEDRIKIRLKIIEKDPCIQLVALYENKIVGFCDAGPLYFRSNQNISTEQRKNRNEPGEIYAIYVAPECQNKGIGKALFTQGRNEL